MKRAMVVITLLGLATQASADNRDTWQGVFAGSVTVAAGGLMMYVHGATKVSDAEDELCARGGYAYDPHCTTLPMLSEDELIRLNKKGDRGATIANIGIATTGVAVIFVGVAFYKGFIAKPKRESAVVVAPTITQQSAGAAVVVSW